MSLLFIRNYRLEIEGNGVLTTITGLRIEFLCKKNRSSTANEMTVKVYNPNREDRKSTRLNSSHSAKSRMPSSA